MSERPNLERDLKDSPHIVKKVRESQRYAQNLYAALCNSEFVKADNAIEALSGNWSCSWRSAGEIVADIQAEGGCYMDWYCTGIISDLYEDKGHVPEGVVTDEIWEDIRSIGWEIIPCVK